MKHIKNHKIFLLLSCLLPVLLGGCAISTLPADIPVPEDSQPSQEFPVPEGSQASQEFPILEGSQTSQEFSVPEGSQLSQEFSAPSSDAAPGGPQIEEEYSELTKRVSLDGTYGTITLSLPYDWNYSLCPEQSDSLTVCDYAILIHPEAAEEGYLEIGYAPLFGTCGTGLTEKEITLAGETASVGYYNDESSFSFLVFTGQKEHLLVLPSSITDWSDSDLEEIWSILDSLEWVPAGV